MSIQAQIVDAANLYGVDPSLALAVAKNESAFNQAAVSGAGAIGVMQLMPATAADLGVNPYDAAQNIDGGVRYLSQMLARFGDPATAVAAYNMGPGAVGSGMDWYAETKTYVSRVMADYGSLYTPQPTFSVDVWGSPITEVQAGVASGLGGSGTLLLLLFMMGAVLLSRRN